MNTYEFRELTFNDIAGMAELLEARQDRESETFPFLRNSLLQRKGIQDRLQRLLAEDRGVGVGAFKGGRLAGYLLAVIRIDTRSGRCAFVPYEGAALRTGQSGELLRHLYAQASVLWLEHGCFSHSVFIPLADPAYFDAFLRLSFAIEQVYAVLHTEEYKPFAGPEGAAVRLAAQSDQGVMGKLSSVISKYQSEAPAFIPALPEVMQDIRAGFQGLVEDEENTVLLAEKDGDTLGFLVYRRNDPALMLPDDSVELCVAGTVRTQMGRGVGKGLMDAGCRMMKEQGFRYITTDWRITNLASSTFWPQCGFRPIAYRMHRLIDPNIAWANVNNPGIQQL